MDTSHKKNAEKSVSIYDIANDETSQFSLNFSFHEKEYSFNTKLIRFPDSYQIFFSPIILQNKILNFAHLEGVSVELVCIRENQKPIVWRDVKLELAKDRKPPVYQLKSDSYGVEFNRRGSFRLFLGINGDAQIGLHTSPIPVVIKDISASGVSFVTNEEREETEVHIIFKDKDLNANFNIHANVVRVSQTENGRYVYGCHFSEEQQSVEKYIQKKQLHELQSQRAQSK